MELPLEPALLSSTLGLEEEGLEEEGLEESLDEEDLEEEGLEEEDLDEEGLEEEGLEEEGYSPQFGRWSSGSVVVDFMVVDVGAFVVIRSRSTFTPPVSTKVKSLPPTPNRFGLFVVFFFLVGRDFLVVL